VLRGLLVTSWRLSTRRSEPVPEQRQEREQRPERVRRQEPLQRQERRLSTHLHQERAREQGPVQEPVRVRRSVRVPVPALVLLCRSQPASGRQWLPRELRVSC
jgi:hypothetical protein